MGGSLGQVWKNASAFFKTGGGEGEEKGDMAGTEREFFSVLLPLLLWGGLLGSEVEVKNPVSCGGVVNSVPNRFMWGGSATGIAVH